MARYVDGFVVPVSTKNIEAYRRMAGNVWKEFGALEYIECVADEVKPDKVNAKVMADPRIVGQMDRKKMPFDPMRMFWDGFKTMAEL